MDTRPVVALLTDFGMTDAYVGTMKGVILTACPDAQLVDLTHAIAPQNVRQAAYVLLTAFRYFGPHTVFLVVVDPGVGTARDPVAVQTDHGLYVAPDNGVLSYVLARLHTVHAVKLANPAYQRDHVSRTFHGRDVFSPAAAHLACGVPLDALGPEADTLRTLPEPRLTITPEAIQGEVLHVDHFGNVITSIGALTWRGDAELHLAPEFAGPHPTRIAPLEATTCQVELGGHVLRGIRATYGAVQRGELVALVGSSGQLEIGKNQGHAARALHAVPGNPVTLKRNA